MARGIQNQVLAGMAMGLPVVGTTPSTQGVGGAPWRHYLAADGVGDQTAAVWVLLADGDRRSALGGEGRRFVEEHYGWDRCVADLDSIPDWAVLHHRATSGGRGRR